MTDTETRTHNAKDILAESLATIQATFWVQHVEAKFAAIDLWDDIDKGIIASPDENAGYANLHFFTDDDHDNKVKVTGVCSIGAIALANVTLYDEPLDSFSSIAMRDIETWKAAQALAQVIVEGEPGFLDEDSGATIANWNDFHGRTREEIVAAFEKALASPLLVGTEFYLIVGESPEGIETVHHFFTSEEKAREFIATPSELRDRMLDYTGCDADGLKPEKYTHPSLIGSNA